MNCHCEERSDEAISKKKRGAELSLRTPNRGDAIPKKGGEGEASPWFALRCSPPPRLGGPPLKPPALKKFMFHGEKF